MHAIAASAIRRFCQHETSPDRQGLAFPSAKSLFLRSAADDGMRSRPVVDFQRRLCPLSAAGRPDPQFGKRPDVAELAEFGRRIGEFSRPPQSSRKPPNRRRRIFRLYVADRCNRACRADPAAAVDLGWYRGTTLTVETDCDRYGLMHSPKQLLKRTTSRGRRWAF